MGTLDSLRGSQATLDLDFIEATARAATPGRWHEFDGCVWTDVAECLHHGPSTAADREHVATMDPSTTLALVARVRELEARHDPCICGPWHPASDGPKEECPRHGREYGWWVERAEAKERQLLDAEARLEAVDEFIAEAMERLSAAEAQLKGRCLADITLRDDDHRLATCILPEGHTFEHDDGMGCLWTDGDHRAADHSDAARLAAVDELHFAEYDDGPNVCFDDRADWPCPTHLAIHPECADECQHAGGAE